ncbi:MAG: rod shape-determining protein MreC [Tissierellia bacterium]|nr:rod shape-determining protein MreC [Tissierellia bacterium]
MIYYRKKESNKKHYIKILILVGLIGLTIINPIISKVSSNVLSFITKPIYEVSSFINNEIRGLIDYTIGSKPNREKLESLTLQNQKLQEENMRLNDIVNNSEALKRELEFSKKIKTLKAKVINMENDSFFSKFTVNKGSNDGVKVGDLVMSDYSLKSENIVGSLVGRVEEVNFNSSRVSTILDNKFNFTFTHSKSRAFGIIDDRIGEELGGYMFDNSIKVEKNDAIYTSGIGGVYQSGIYIGQISEVKESNDKIRTLIKVKSPVDFKKIYNVFIISNTESIKTEVENE